MFKCQTFEDSSFGSFLANACGLASLQAIPSLNDRLSNAEILQTCVAQFFCRFPLFTFRLPGPKPQWGVSAHQKSPGAIGHKLWEFPIFSLTKHWTSGDSTRRDGKGGTKTFPAGARCS